MTSPGSDVLITVCDGESCAIPYKKMAGGRYGIILKPEMILANNISYLYLFEVDI